MYILVILSSLLASLVTFYSGFGLGTILMAVLAIFFPLPQAIIITAIVHLINSGLKSSLLFKSIHWNIALKFGSIALIAAIPGALLFKKLSFLPTIQDYSLLGITAKVTALKITIGSLLILIAGASLFHKKQLPSQSVVVSGIISGFLGGLSGNQGAFRSIFLIRIESDKKRFIATSSIISVAIDLTRLVIYLFGFAYFFKKINITLLVSSLCGAIIGIIIGMLLLKSITIQVIQLVIVILLFLFGSLMIAGFI
ncbi:MAG: TSUP family transporter [Chlamydiota bacterium]|jgi:uncharacterized membrane protein YfcA